METDSTTPQSSFKISTCLFSRACFHMDSGLVLTGSTS